jgi:Flp pilus assembly protein TadG
MASQRSTHGRFDRFRSETGISLIHVAMLLFVFMGFSMFVTDLGALWLARGQAQNAADAGALAGAIARAFDDTSASPAIGGIVDQSAQAAVANHTVVDGAPTATVLLSGRDAGACPSYAAAGATCVRVNVFRDGTNSSTTLPTFFGNVFGITSQKIKATATAQVGVANATDCLRPFAVPDLFIDVNPGDANNPVGQYHHYYGNGANRGNPLPNPDTYIKPTQGPPATTGTGYTIANNYGQQLTLKFGNPSASDPISPGWYLPIAVPLANSPDTGANRYRDNIAGCNGIPVEIGQYLPTETGAVIGPTKMGIQALIDQDPDAYWSNGEIVDTCAPSCGQYSPRVIALAVYDVEQLDHSMATNDWSYCVGGGKCVQIVNFLAFFVDHITPSGDVVGYLTREAAILTTDGGTTNVGGPSAFLYVIQLIQ